MLVKRKWFFLFLLGSCFCLFADDLEKRIEDLEASMNNVYLQSVQDTCGSQFSAGQFFCPCDPHYFVAMEVLYWHAKRGGTDWVYREASGIFPKVKGPMKQCEFRWDFGLRAGVGKYFDNDFWLVSLYYTYYRTADTSKVNQPFFSQVGLGTVDPDDSGPFGNGRGKFSCKVVYNALDLDLFRALYFSSKLNFSPAIGLKTTFLDQEQKLIALDFINSNDTFFPANGTVYTKLKERCKFWGLGPKGSINALWEIGKGFRFEGNLAAALHYGLFKILEKERIVLTPEGEPQDEGQVNMSHRIHRCVPWAKIFLGLTWHSLINCDKQSIEFGLGYEVEYFWRAVQFLDVDYVNPAVVTAIPLNQSIRINYKTASEDLSFFGLTGKVLWKF